jgi:uncharacterized protein YfaS (alpha-2-macroglobulin family)
MSGVGGPPATHKIHGCVVRPDGAPIRGAVVSALDHDGKPLSRTVSDEHGWFSLADTNGSAPLVLATADGHDPAVAVADYGEEVRLRLPPAPGPVGRVVDDSTARPVAGATVTVTDARGEVLAATHTGGDGDFLLTGLAAEQGPYMVVASAAGYRPAAATLDQRGPQRIALSAAAELCGTVVEDGKPMAGIAVVAVDASGHPVARSATDAAGRFAFPDLAPGRYTVSAGRGAPASAALPPDHTREAVRLDLTMGDAPHSPARQGDS